MNRSRRVSEKPCRDFARGNCRYGSSCRFSHDSATKVSSTSPAHSTRKRGSSKNRPRLWSPLPVNEAVVRNGAKRDAPAASGNPAKRRRYMAREPPIRSLEDARRFLNDLQRSTDIDAMLARLSEERDRLKEFIRDIDQESLALLVRVMVECKDAFDGRAFDSVIKDFSANLAVVARLHWEHR
ncbi:hypothetical protein FOL47_008682 [Perkinsus chesapeaki]|uniref:C3H1-type domain-containing protein n=1 Tax=Perkinsus chesapeaki TaxID=330153 RepID=A0A7J6MTF2_PERCH|nr:hypothetical protein FOL47_008682 [Perkinsus chesapeaki]